MKAVLSRIVGVALAIAGLAVALPAHASFTYTVGGIAPQHFPGPVMPPANAPWGVNGYPGDTVQLLTYTDTIDLVPGTYTKKINTLLWTVDWTYAGTATDPNAWTDLTFHPEASRNMHIDGAGTKTLDQEGTLLVTWNPDNLSFSVGSKKSFNFVDYRVDVTPLAVGPLEAWGYVNPPWVQPSQDMMAQFDVYYVPGNVPDQTTDVPEPSQVAASLVAMLGVGGFVLRQKFSRKAAN